MAIFIMSMVLVFAFATNIGMLVHAKINLQNAADAAAYAGAAVQARQMTAIAYMNWEMRRAVKQFLFNWMVRGNLSQACFPSDSSGQAAPSLCAPEQGPRTSKYLFSFRDPRPREAVFNEPRDDYLPTVCIIFDPSNNYCQKTVVAGIPELGGLTGVLTFVNPIINAVRRSTQIIIQKKIDDCVARGNGNLLYMTAWIFNLDPNPLPVAIQNDFDTAFPITGSLDGLGVLVRQAILRARIDNFEEALNLNLQHEGFPDSTISASVVNELLSQADKRDYYERPIQAFLSAKNNLPTIDENGIFSDVRLTELIPFQTPAARNPNLQNDPVLFKLNDINDDVKVAASKFISQSQINRGECAQQRQEMRIPSFPIGVAKDPQVITYYAVNLKANARLLFSPFGSDGTVTLSAYSAAMPFGSRIGKNLEENPDRFIHAAGKRVHTDALVGEFKKAHHFINLLVSDDDREALSDGFASNGNLGYLRRAISLAGFGRAKAFKLAGAYTPWEVGYYTVPANFDGISHFPNNPNYTGTGRAFELRAPIVPVKSPGADLHFLRGRIEAMFTTTGFLNPGDTNAELEAIKANYLNDANLTLLEGFLRGLGQDRSHFISDPILLDDPDLRNYALREGQKYTVAGKQGQLRQLTSWNTQKTSTYPGIEAGSELGPGIGRAGYSVRFVNFHSLTQGGIASNDGNIQWTDPFARINPSGAEAQRILDEIRALRH